MYDNKILITGSTGFVGSCLLRSLIERFNGKNIHIFIRRNSNLWRIKDVMKEVNCHIVDLKDKDQVYEIVSLIKPQWIFHCATYGGYPFQTDSNEIISTNFIGTINLLEASIKNGFKAFINTGSSSEYGIKNKPMNEEDFPDPINIYGVSKL